MAQSPRLTVRGCAWCSLPATTFVEIEGSGEWPACSTHASQYHMLSERVAVSRRNVELIAAENAMAEQAEITRLQDTIERLRGWIEYYEDKYNEAWDTDQPPRVWKG